MGQVSNDVANARDQGEDQGQGRLDPLLVLLHIPKTAGTSVARVMLGHFGTALVGGPADARLPPQKHPPNVFSRSKYVAWALRPAARPETRGVAAHITFGLRHLFPRDVRWMTILRDPVERTLSHYFYFVRPPGGHRRAGAGFLPPGLPSPGPDLTIEDALREGGYIPDNLQVRMLCGIASPYDPLPPDALEQAKRNLASFAYVGTTERCEEFLALLNLELGWPTVALPHVNTNPERPPVGELPARDLALVEERNRLDRELYDFAGTLLDAAVASAPPGFADEVKVLQHASGPASLDVDPRTLPFEARVALARASAEIAALERNLRRVKSSRVLDNRARRAAEAGAAGGVDSPAVSPE